MTDLYTGKKALIMGLGVNGGGLASAEYLVKHGALVSVTDLRCENELRESISELNNFVKTCGAKEIRYILGKHEIADFQNSDIVIKNPGVKPDSPYLEAAEKARVKIETDIGIFLSVNNSVAGHGARLTAVTGSKGKSFTSSAIFYLLDNARKDGLLPGAAYLGGNITYSPLLFADKLTADDDVVLELSSWQTGDLKNNPLLKPKVALVTAIMSDHQNWYHNMEDYMSDKQAINKFQTRDDVTIAYTGVDATEKRNVWGLSFLQNTKGKKISYTTVEAENFFDCPVAAGGIHNKTNIYGAYLACVELGLEPLYIKEKLAKFPGIEHRLEFFYQYKNKNINNKICFYNDSAATIPEAAASALHSFENIVLVTGGTDKNLDFTPLAKAAHLAVNIVLLEGSGTDKLIPLFAKENISYYGPYSDFEAAVKEAINVAKNIKCAGDINVILSPGCTSFGMFANEFERGRSWKNAVRDILG
jgi:UDP-N-acetylmuramoylalanine--D-glutamate ligase